MPRREIYKKLIFIGVALILIIGGFFIYKSQTKEEEKTLSLDEATDVAVNYINENLLQGQATISLIEKSEESGLYKMKLKLQDNEFDVYISKDGKLLFTQAIDMTVSEEIATQEIPKRDVPDVKLFVMSYCPYGLQAEKAFLPAYNLLNDKAKMGVYFVDYIMHGENEIKENLRQYCIEKDEPDKYSSYLECFVKEGKSSECSILANINEEKINTCISQTDEEFSVTSQYNDKSTWISGKFPKFDVHSELNKKYKVAGSPTIVINDAVVNLTKRSPEEFKNTICQAFNTEPEECLVALSDEVSGPGFGETKGSTNSGSCQ